MIVHPELDRHEGWFERQYVATEALPHRLLDHLLLRGFVRGEKLFFIRVRSLPQPGSVTAPANVSKSQLPGRVTRQGVGLDVSRSSQKTAPVWKFPRASTTADSR